VLGSAGFQIGECRQGDIELAPQAETPGDDPKIVPQGTRGVLAGHTNYERQHLPQAATGHTGLVDALDLPVDGRRQLPFELVQAPSQ
jgi:hypothetical protein